MPPALPHVVAVANGPAERIEVGESKVTIRRTLPT